MEEVELGAVREIRVEWEEGLRSTLGSSGAMRLALLAHTMGADATFQA